MASNDLHIFEAMLAHLKEFEPSPAVPVEWPNKTFTPPKAGGWLRPSWLPAQTFTMGPASDSSDQLRGLFQVSVFWPSGNYGAVDAVSIAGQVVSHFAKGTVLNRGGIRVVVVNAPYVSAMVSEPSETERMWINFPVNVPYFASGKETD